MNGDIVSSAARHTQIIYNEWNLPPQAGYVRRLETGFEFGMRKLGFLIYPWGPRTKKTVHDRQIVGVTHWPNWIVIKFDGTDEIRLNDGVLSDFDHSTVSYPILDGFDNDSSGVRLRALQGRQRALGAVSWEHGRTGPMTTSSASARRAKIAVIAIAVAGLALSILLSR